MVDQEDLIENYAEQIRAASEEVAFEFTQELYWKAWQNGRVELVDALQAQISGEAYNLNHED